MGKGVVELVVVFVQVRRLASLASVLTLPGAIVSDKVSGIPDAKDKGVAENGPFPVPLVVPDASVEPDDVAVTRNVN